MNIERQANRYGFFCSKYRTLESINSIRNHCYVNFIGKYFEKIDFFYSKKSYADSGFGRLYDVAS